MKNSGKQIFNTLLGSFFSSNYTKYVVNRILISVEVEFHFQRVIFVVDRTFLVKLFLKFSQS